MFYVLAVLCAFALLFLVLDLFLKEPPDLFRRVLPKPKRTVLELEVLGVKICPSTVNLIAAGNWSDPSIWSTHAVPTSNDDVVLDGNYSNGDVTFTNPGMAAHSISLDANYLGTLHVGAMMGTYGLTLAGGAIDQPNGVGTSDINVMGLFTWSAGVLNSSAAKAALNLWNGTATLTGTNLTTGDDLNLNSMTLHLANSGNLTFTNNAGVTLTNTALFSWETTANIVTTGTGMFQNNGGFLVKSALSGVATVTSDLPYVNNSPNAFLTVQKGTLRFDKPGAANGVSVLQNSGTITLGVDGSQGATLQVDSGLTMNNGTLRTATDETSNIAVGDVKVHGGLVRIGDGGIGELDRDGFVTMDGGNYVANVDANAITSDTWLSTKGFLIGNTATLTVSTIKFPPVGGVPPGKLWIILATGAKNDITGDFGSKNVGFGDGSGKNYTAAPDPTNQYYDLRS